MDHELLTFAGWVASPAGATELTRGYFLEQLRRWLAVVSRQQVHVHQLPHTPTTLHLD